MFKLLLKNEKGNFLIFAEEVIGPALTSNQVYKNK
jgi:hypothetical protein